MKAFALRRFARSLRLVSAPSCEIPGLSARLDKLCHYYGGCSLPADKPHAFIYFITLSNSSERRVTLLARKWILEYENGSRTVLEGDGIVGETPRLGPGEAFTYNSYHVTGCDAVVRGSFHGVDDRGNKIHVILPPFALRIPKPQA